MNAVKKMILFIVIILFLSSIYKDLTIGTVLPSSEEPQKEKEEMVKQNLTVMRVKVQQNDTVLSIVEKINPSYVDNLNIQKVTTDFKQLNPTTDPHHLQIGQFYYFPIYDKEAAN